MNDGITEGLKRIKRLRKIYYFAEIPVIAFFISLLFLPSLKILIITAVLFALYYLLFFLPYSMYVKLIPCPGCNKNFDGDETLNIMLVIPGTPYLIYFPDIKGKED